MKVEINLPSELVDLIADRVIEKLKPLLAVKQEREKDEIFTVRSLAYYLKVSQKWINELIRANEIPCAKTKGQIKFKKSEIDKWYQRYNAQPDRKVIKGKEKNI
jgi:excisionase family DNA binding protein